MVIALQGARLRLIRAEQHIQKFEGLCDKAASGFQRHLRKHWFGGRRSARIPVEQMWSLLDSPNPGFQTIPADLALLMGEAVYNLRAALDYLVGDLSRAYTPVWTGAKPRRNQFPIERDRDGFNARAVSSLAGVSPADVEIIADCQPFNGRPWLLQLAELSNRDKHNELVGLLHGGFFELAQPKRVTFYTAVMVKLTDGHHDAVDLLGDIYRHVEGLLMAFECTFDGEEGHDPGVD